MRGEIDWKSCLESVGLAKNLLFVTSGLLKRPLTELKIKLASLVFLPRIGVKYLLWLTELFIRIDSRIITDISLGGVSTAALIAKSCRSNFALTSFFPITFAEMQIT